MQPLPQKLWRAPFSMFYLSIFNEFPQLPATYYGSGPGLWICGLWPVPPCKVPTDQVLGEALYPFNATKRNSMTPKTNDTYGDIYIPHGAMTHISRLFSTFDDNIFFSSFFSVVWLSDHFQLLRNTLGWGLSVQLLWILILAGM